MRIAQFIGLMFLAGLLTSASAQAPSPLIEDSWLSLTTRIQVMLDRNTYSKIYANTAADNNPVIAHITAVEYMEREARERTADALCELRSVDPVKFDEVFVKHRVGVHC